MNYQHLQHTHQSQSMIAAACIKRLGTGAPPDHPHDWPAPRATAQQQDCIILHPSSCQHRRASPASTHVYARLCPICTHNSKVPPQNLVKPRCLEPCTVARPTAYLNSACTSHRPLAICSATLALMPPSCQPPGSQRCTLQLQAHTFKQLAGQSKHPHTALSSCPVPNLAQGVVTRQAPLHWSGLSKHTHCAHLHTHQHIPPGNRTSSNAQTVSK